jgi:hypothetical protein
MFPPEIQDYFLISLPEKSYLLSSFDWDWGYKVDIGREWIWVDIPDMFSKRFIIEGKPIGLNVPVNSSIVVFGELSNVHW